MADTQGAPAAGIDQVSTLDVGPAPVPAPGQSPPPQGGPMASTHAPNQGPQPNASAGNSPQGQPSDPTSGVGTEGEVEVWEAHYSPRNFLGRLIAWSILSVAWLALAIYAWGYDHTGLAIPAVVAAIVLGLLWISLGVQMMRAYMGHKYRLTTRRLFIESGIFHRETDQLELLRVQDVFNRQQSLMERLLGVGSVIIVSDQKSMPNYVLLGVADPKGVMDLVWHHARAEQDQRNVRVEQI